MGRLVKASLTAALFAGVALAESSNTWFEQWFKAKFGHSSPAQEARTRAEAANTAYREDTTATGQTSIPARQALFEQWFKAKYGRNSPAEEARRKAELANTAFRDDPSASHDRDGWTREFVKAKYGRDLPKK